MVQQNKNEKTFSYSQLDSELNVSLLKDAMRYLIELITLYPDIVNHGGQIVPILSEAVLDEDQLPLVTRQDSVRVNWLINRQSFDFDRIEIIQASDEDIERFAMQVGNDTDEFRRETVSENGMSHLIGMQPLGKYNADFG